MEIATLEAKNQERWSKANLTRGPEFARVCDRLIKGKPRYKVVEKITGVPWFIIAVIHEREASGSWNGNLAQGDPWDEVSTHVPKGRGPFNSWEDAAVDALTKCPPYASKCKNWSAGSALTLLEQYNGLGYAYRGRPSPYVWSGTDIYDPPKGPGGKIKVDHGPIEPDTDKQLGCAGLLLGLKALDPSISFTGEKTPPTPDIPKPAPVPADPIWLQVIKTAIAFITRK